MARLRLAAVGCFAAALIFGAAVAGWSASGYLERRSMRQAEETVQAAGAAWARVHVDGAIATIYGDAPSERARFDMVRRVAALSGVAVVRDLVTAGAPTGGVQVEPAIDVLIDDAALTLTGLVAGEARREEVSRAFAEIAGARSFIDLLESAPFDDGADWTLAEEAAVEIAGLMRRGSISYSASRLTVRGVCADDIGAEDAARIEAEARASGLFVTVALAPPAVAKVDFRFAAAIGPEGGEISACAVSTERDASWVAARAGGALGAEAVCTVALGAPDERWGDAVLSGIDALEGLATGAFALEGRVARFESEDAAAAARAEALRASLPDGYALTAFVPDAAAPEAGADTPEARAPAQRRASAIRLTLNAADARIEGAAPDAGTAAALAAYAEAALPGREVTAQIASGANAADPGWRAAVLAGLSAAAALDSGEIAIGDGAMALTGVVEQPERAAALHRALSDAAPTGWRALSRITVDAPGLAERQFLPIGRCAEELAALVEAEPIQFEPASADIDSVSLPLVARLGAVVARCGAGVIEIGGHTDAQGSEGFNLSLSRARAETVLDALVEGGAPIDRLIARGFGESAPIADNGTEQGRARNRRIAFSVADEGDQRAALRDGDIRAGIARDVTGGDDETEDSQ